MRTYYSRTLRIISVVTLAFFSWTFVSLWEIPAAIAAEKSKTPGAKSAGTSHTAEPRPATSGEKFEKAVEDIRTKLRWAEDKSNAGVEPKPEIEAIKAKKAELEGLASELRAEFSATEKKLIDAKLKKEILDRHYKFVKNYQDNLKELVGNLDQLSKAEEKTEVVAAVRKAREHLDRVKAPSRHQKLDPNNLPFRARKAKTSKAPRLKREDFEKDFPQQKKKVHDARYTIQDEGGQTSWATRPAEVASHHASWIMNHGSVIKPILVASNGPLTGLLSSDPKTEISAPPFSEPALSITEGNSVPTVVSAFALNSDLSTLNLALASTDAPTAADLDETPEVQFTQDIRNLAAQLSNSPVKIFEWVRNNIEYVPTYGSIQGADMCLQSQQCNDMDTASLLIALLRVSNIPAHYAYGTIEVPIDQIKNWVGGFSDPQAALTLLSSGGVPVAVNMTGGTISKARLEHAWVEAYIPYGNYRGAIMDQSIKTWIPLDGSFKQYTYTNGFDIMATVPFNQDDYLSQVQTQNPVHYYQSKIQAYLDANLPDTSIIDVKGYRQITQETYHFLPSTLPYITKAQFGQFSSVPDSIAAKATFMLSNPATGSAVSYTATTAELAGKRLTVSYIPATASDEALIAKYGKYLYAVPAYMLNLKPVLRLGGSIQLTGEEATMGSDGILSLSLMQADGSNESIQKNLVTGTFYAVGLDLQGVNENVLGKRNAALTSSVLSESASTLGNDELIGEFLYIRAINYFLANDKIYGAGAKLYNVAMTRTPSEAIISFPLAVSSIFSLPKSVKPAGAEMDVAMDRIIAISKEGNNQKEKSYMDIAGLVSSYHEHAIFEKIDQFDSVSAVKAIQSAAASNVPVYKITAANLSQILPVLQVDSGVIQDIQNAVNAGQEVTVPQANVKIVDWSGVGYFVKDPVSGSGAYRISGGLNGAFTVAVVVGVVIAGFIIGPLVFVLAALFLMMGNTVAEAAELEDGGMCTNDEQIEQAILTGSQICATYESGKQCTGFVISAYLTAGIDLVALARAKHEGHPIYSPNLYRLARDLNINHSVRMTNDSLLPGDIIFWKYTYDRDKNCWLGNDEQPTHVGIVVEIFPDGRVRFAHNSSKGVSSQNIMNINQPTNPQVNTFLNNPWPACIRCAVSSDCPATTYCPAGRMRTNFCNENDFDNYGHLAGQLFNGYATIRNVSNGVAY